jgi:hypothetical protein
VIVMKCLPLVLLFGATMFAEPEGARTVYILPMPGGLDQYIAGWLTRDHVLQVLADPKAADLILTDRLGEPFEQKLTLLHPPAGAAARPPGPEDPDSRTAGAGTGGAVRNEFRTSRGRGTIFMVDAKSRQVLWSDYEKPAATSPKSLNREAGRIVKKLRENYVKSAPAKP